MATAILRSHDCLRDRFAARNPNPRTRWRRRNGNRRSNGEMLSLSAPKRGLVMGPVKILKRGEELKPRLLDLCSTDRLGPDPEIVKKQIRVSDLYAGVSSPPPSSLPFPSSFVCRTLMESGLRKLLKI